MVKEYESPDSETQLRQLSLLNDIFSNLILETTPAGMLQRLLEGGIYITRAEFGIAFFDFAEMTSAFAQVGLQMRDEDSRRSELLLRKTGQEISAASSLVEVFRDPTVFAALSPPLPPIAALRGMCLLMGKRKAGFLIVGHSNPRYDFMGGDGALVQLITQAGFMAERFDLFAQVEEKSRALEEANKSLRDSLSKSEEQNILLKEAQGAIEKSKAELESFVYTASHDLKAPIVSLHGMASALMEDFGDKLDEHGRHYLDRLMANANFIEQLIADLLELSRVGRRERKPQKLQVELIIEDILNQCEKEMAQKKVQVALRGPFPSVTSDQTQLSQVFLNLITNAIKFMGLQPTPLIEIGGQQVEEMVEFYVKDNGIGIDPQYQDQIFEVFQRLKEVEVEGSGMGLAIVKKIINLAGGKIWVKSEKGRGATFFFRIPAISAI